MFEKDVIRRRNLPHWDFPGAAFFVTTCLEGSIPAQGRLDIEGFRRELRLREKPANRSDVDWRVHCWKLEFNRTEEWIDLKAATDWLQRPDLAKIVVDAMLFFAEERYDLLAYVVMPSHIHWLFQPRQQWIARLPNDGRTLRERITYSMNRYSATQCNKCLKVTGAFWQTESYDHWVRDLDELERILRYIEANPVKAGLVSETTAWKFSSAWSRNQLGLDPGSPIPRCARALY
jgi:type I restriction enzyme R subunit